MSEEKVRREMVVHWKDVFKYVLKKWWIVLISAVIGAIGGFFAGGLLSPNVYQSEAIYLVSVMNVAGVEGPLSTIYGVASSKTILANCVTIAEQNTFRNLVAEQLNEGLNENSKGYISSEDLMNYVSYSYSSSTTIISIVVETDSAEKSYKITEAIVDNFSEYMEQLPQLGGANSMKYTLVNTPELAKGPEAGTSRFVYAVLFGAALGVLAAVVLIVISLADTRIKNEEDLTDKYTLPVLGVIPYFDKEKQEEAKK